MVRILAAFVALILLFAILALSAHRMWGTAGLFGVLLTGVACLFLLRFLASRMLRRAFEAPFAAKGAVLGDAEAVVHSITLATAPANDPTEEPEEEVPIPRVWYSAELTITPQPSAGPFHLWEPGELTLAGPDARSTRELDEVDEEPGYEIWQVWWWDGEKWMDDQGEKHEGEQRLRLLFSAPATVRRVRLRYYFGVFGEIDLPAAG